MTYLAGTHSLLTAILGVFLMAMPCLAQTASVPEKAHLVPHRATYAVSLKNVKNGSSVQSVSGTMLFGLSDTCEGWATDQQLQLHFNFADGDASDVASAVATWESKNGSAFRFNVKRTTDGTVDEVYKGKARMTSGKGGEATYAQPEDKANIALPAQTVFPARHTAQILDNAFAGNKLFMRRVFDGSEEEGMVDASTFIGGKEDATTGETPKGLEGAALALWQHPYWPVRLAYYKPDDQTGEPDYEMEMLLQDNGIARSMVIDYGEFSLLGTLTALAPNEPTGCGVKQGGS